MAKLKLPDVTLLIYNPVRSPDLSARVLNHCMSLIDFGAVVHLARERPAIQCCAQFVQVPSGPWVDGQIMQALQLGRYFETRWMLHVETDGFPVNPHRWEDEFLHYDYIGAPWPYALHSPPQRYRVGNGGCSLQSKRFRDQLECMAPMYHMGQISDVWFCQDIRDALEARGIRYAPLDVARRFSHELPIEEFPGWAPQQSFAFHGRYSWHQEYLALVESQAVL